MKFCRYDYYFSYSDIYLIPTIRIFINDLYLGVENFSITIHIFSFHCRWLWVKEVR